MLKMSLSPSKIGCISLTILQIFCQIELPAWKKEKTQETQIKIRMSGGKLKIFLLKILKGKFHT